MNPALNILPAGVLLYDRILSGDYRFGGQASSPLQKWEMQDRSYLVRAIKAGMRASPVMRVDNVAQYFFADEDKDWSIDDFPCLLPPFQSAWLEYTHPILAQFGHSTHRVGVWMETRRHETLAELRELSNQTMWNWHDNPLKSQEHSVPTGLRAEATAIFEQSLRGDFVDEARHFYSVRLVLCGDFHVNGKALWSPFFVAGMFLNHEGARCSDHFQIMSFLGGRPDEEEHKNPLAPVNRSLNGYYTRLTVGLLYPFFLALTFCHCKNIELAQRAPAPKLAKSYAKRHKGHALSPFHEIAIEPVRRILEGEGKQTRVGLQKALHITRGHFKHYSAEKPLFGRVTGTVWCPSHTRGNREKGEVKKRYTVLRDPVLPVRAEEVMA